MNNNIMIQNVPTVAWDGANSRAFDIRGHVQFGWAFEALADLADDAVFTVEFAAPSAADDCQPDAFAPVQEIATCSGGAVGGDQTITIPAGTVAGTICGGTIPCRAGAFLRVVSTSGPTDDILGVMLRHGPNG